MKLLTYVPYLLVAAVFFNGLRGIGVYLLLVAYIFNGLLWAVDIGLRDYDDKRFSFSTLMRCFLAVFVWPMFRFASFC